MKNKIELNGRSDNKIVVKGEAGPVRIGRAEDLLDKLADKKSENKKGKKDTVESEK